VRGRSLAYSGVASLLLALVTLLFLASPALAAVAQPDTIAIAEVHAYRHCLEDDDLLIIVKYHLDYTTNPDDSVEYTYLGRLIDGTDQLDIVTPYSYYNSGYDWGIFSFYFEASSAPAWEGSYTVRFEGNPALTWDGGTPPLESTNSITWHATTTQGATEALLETKILSLADDLSDRWSVTLTQEVTGGTTLNSAGVQYFSNSIDDLRDMVPDIFPTGIEAVEFTEEEHTQAYETTLLSRIGTGDILGKTRASVANLLGVDNSLAGAILFLMFLGVVTWGIAYGTGGQIRPVAFILVPLVIMGNLIGLLSLAFTVVIGLLSVMASAYILFYSKSSA